MEVLVVESEPRAADIAIVQLEGMGHRVKRCHEPEAGEQSFPCIGLATGHCPLEEDEVDVALTVRGASHANPTALEDGITCALRRKVPVVISGRTDLNPFERYGVTMADQSVGDACERAATERRVDYEAIAHEALDWTLRYRDLPTDTARVEIRRVGSGLQVTLRLPAGSTKLVGDMAAVRVAGALRRFDPHIAQIGVACEMKP
jgi:hypothetical protein